MVTKREEAIAHRLRRPINSVVFALLYDDYPYKFPKNYIQWKELSALSAIAINPSECDRLIEKGDFASFFTFKRLGLFVAQNAPVYTISKELLSALEQTQVIDDNYTAKGLIDLNLPTFLILLPSDTILTPSGGCLDFFVVHVSQRDKPQNSIGTWKGVDIPYFPHSHPVNIHWGGIDTGDTTWFSGWGFYPDTQKVVFTEDNQLGTAPLDKQDKAFAAKMRELTLSILLVLAYEPELISEGIPNKKKNRKTKKSIFIHPRRLGINYKIKHESPKSSKSSNCLGTPKRSHWRQGHWRRQPCGKNKQDTRLVRIDPILINP